MPSIDDLQPPTTKIKIKDREFDVMPIKLGHALLITKLGGLFNRIEDLSLEEIDQVEKGVDKLIGELIPELKGLPLGINETMDVLQELMNSAVPTENKEIEEHKIKMADESPKDQRTG